MEGIKLRKNSHFENPAKDRYDTEINYETVEKA